MWGALLGGGASVLSARSANKQAAEQQKQQMLQNALETKYSPWIAAQKQQVQNAPQQSMLGAALGGGLQGHMAQKELFKSPGQNNFKIPNPSGEGRQTPWGQRITDGR